MILNDFSTLLQLAATLNIAFVAVEYAKAYTHTLSEKVFKFQTFIVESFETCVSALIDKETLEHIDPVMVEGNSTLKEIEKVKREREVIVKNIEDEKKRLSEDVMIMCESKSLSSLSLFLFLYTTLALFLGAIEHLFPFFIHIFWCLLTVLTMVFLIVGWSVGEKDKQIKYLDFSLLRHSIVYFIIALALSFVIALVLFFWCPACEDFVSGIWIGVLIFGSLLPFTNFIAFFIKIKNKAKAVKKEITQCSTNINTRCKDLEVLANDLLRVCKLRDRLKVDS